MMRIWTCLAAAMLLVGISTSANACRLNIGGNKCVVAGPPAPEYKSRIMRMRDMLYRGEPLPRGTILPRNRYNILLVADYYGLPPVKDGWVYMEVERNVYRVDFLTYEVLEMVTDQTAANW